MNTNETRETWITTKDNPFDFFNDFDNWYQFDEEKGYRTCEYVARIAKTSDELSELDYSEAIEEALDEIMRNNVLLIYKRIYNDQ